MGLLQMLRPGTTQGWHHLDGAEQLLLLNCARRSRDLPTLRTLAELTTLTGAARTALLGEREPSIRKKILTRRDLTAAETETLLSSETRASVLVAVAGSFPEEKVETLLSVAENSRGTSLTEALLRHGRLTQEQKLRMLRDLASRKHFRDLSGSTAEKIAGILPADPQLLLWVLADSRYSNSRWIVGRVITRFAQSGTTAEQSLVMADALAGAGHGDHTVSYLRHLLDGDNIVARRHNLPLSEIRILADELNRRLDVGTDGWDALRAMVGALLTQLEPLLAKLGAPVALEVTNDPGSDIAWETLTSSEIVAQLTSEQRLDAAAVAQLACNPNHTDPTATKVAQLAYNTPGAALCIIERFEQLNESVWRAIATNGSYQTVLDPGQSIDRVGVEYLASVLSSPTYRPSGSGGQYYWRSTWPLLGSGPLTWLLGDKPHPLALEVALRLPVKDVVQRDEVLTFRLLASQVGDDPAAWDVVDGLIDRWDGTFADLVAVARQINT
jgi:hypothetical protein